MGLFLKGKHILFISAQFFGYQKEICMAMINAGAYVDYFDERPANSAFVKAAIRINRNILFYYINRYYDNIIQKTKNTKYDYIFFIKCESISARHVRILRKMHPQAKLILYHWDSYANNHNASNVAPYFDKIFSFDKEDCDRFNINFLPLFYVPDYAKIARMNMPIKYDMLFIGTVHSDRFRIIKNIESIIESYGGNSYTWFYFPSKLLFYKMWLQDESIRHAQSDKFHYSSIDRRELINIFASSRIVVDIQHPNQTGLTIRCIETLGAKKKLITTNCDIMKYDFYNPNNIQIIDRNKPYISEQFFSSSYIDIPDKIYEEYSLDGWLSHILS